MTTIMKFSSPRFLLNNTLPPVAPQTQRKKNSIVHIKPSFNSLKKGWEYTDSTLGLASNLMSIILESCGQTCKWISKKTNRAIQKTVLHLDLLSIINLPGKIVSIPKKIQKVWESFHWKDHEGAILATMSVTLFMGNMFDTLTSLVNTTLEVLSRKTVGWISKIGLPLAISLAGVDMGLDCTSFYKRFKFRREFNQKVIKKIQEMENSSAKLCEIVAPFLNKHIGEDVTDPTSLLKEKVLKRITSKKVFLQFKQLAELLKKNNLADDKQRDIFMQITTIEKLLKNEERSKTISLISTAIAAIAVCLFLYPPASIVSYSLFAVSATIGLAQKIQEDLESSAG